MTDTPFSQSSFSAAGRGAQWQRGAAVPQGLLGFVVGPKGAPVALEGEDYVSRQTTRHTARILLRKGERALRDPRTVFPLSSLRGFWGDFAGYGAPMAGVS